ncbi:zinc metalloprotease [Pholiota conissans]|uniref:Disintegrin and metalloproteinase domain-containing protein B n=1 Tax=Pholiota conissans TaxID=109636 RepID=A0A9P6D289_9AGAR|nr:zinc metalloprotease [Pholiota conissans]
MSASSPFVSAAHSVQVRPLKRVANPTTISLEILPRNPFTIPSFVPLHKRQSPHPPNSLQYNDSFRLVLSAYNETFHLHLRPNHDLIHPAARIHYYTILPDGKEVLTHTKPLLRESVKAYLGEVVAASHSHTRMREDAAGAVHYPHAADLGWARIMVHNQGDTAHGITPVFEGAFSANGVIYHLMTKDNYLRTKLDLDPLLSDPVDDSDPNLVIWRESDVMTLNEQHFAKTGERFPTQKIVEPQSCGHDRLEYNAPEQNPMYHLPHQRTAWTDYLLKPFSNETIYRRDDVQTGNGGMGTNFINSIGSTQGCPSTQRIIYMGVAADCTYVSTYNGQENATQQILNNWNSASALYKSTFNVSLGIAELQVKSETCPSVADPATPWNVPCANAELDNRLSIFSDWRGQKGNDSIGLWHLMSGCPTGSEVGIAWLATLCQQEATGQTGSTVSGTAVSTAGRTEWQVVAHEIGHNFGAIHDCASGCNMTSSCCPLTTSTCDASGQFIMSPVAQSTEKIFSPCSIGNICSVMTGAQGSSKLDTSCLVEPDPSRQTISLQMCGNGIVENGEDCDPGKGATSNCCDVNTCKFKNNAICDPQSSPCCTAQCSFAPSTQVCRPSRDAQCDTPEFCTGNSSSCPTDVLAKNGQSCGSNGLACASGQCTSVDLQCQTVGASMGLQKACPDQNDQSCQISCQDPSNSGACIRLTSLLIDGSPCGFGGTCISGKCQSAGFLDTAKAWYVQNLQIAIPVTVVAGLIAILILWFLIRSVRRCCGSRQRRDLRTLQGPVAPAMTRAATHERLASYDPLAQANPPATRILPGSSTAYMRVPPAAHDRSRSGDGQELRFNYSANNRMDWVDEGAYNGPRQY